MYKPIARWITILFVVALIISGGLIVSGNDTTSLRGKTETIETTVYRYGPNDITPIRVRVPLREGVKLEDALFDKCAELAENDEEIHQFLNNSTADLSQISYIKSRGRGLHFEFKVRIPVKRYFKKYPNFPPYNRMMRIPIIICNYPFDQRAASSIRELGTGNTTSISGAHGVVATGFLGYTTWIGFVAQRGFILRAGFAGFAVVNVN